MATTKKAAPQKKAAPKKAAPKKMQVPVPGAHEMPPYQSIAGSYDPKPMIDETLDSMIASFQERLPALVAIGQELKAGRIISRASCILAALPGVMRRSSLEDANAIVDQAVNIGDALYKRLEQK